MVWAGCTDRDSKLLENVQLAAARIITGAIKGTSHDAIYTESCLEKLSTRRDKHRLILFYKIVNNETPTYLSNHLPHTVSTRAERSLRNANDISLIKANRDYYQISYFPHTIKLWNNLTNEIKTAPSIESFKHLLYKNCSPKLEYAYLGSRKVNIIMAQMRMECSKLNAHLFKHKVISDSNCSCGCSKETVFHYFFICPVYNTHRAELHNKILHIANAKFDTKTLLYGNLSLTNMQNKQIHDAVSIFITDSKRF